MHEISDKTLQLAQKHAQEINQHGKAVEELGKKVGDASGKFIEEQGVASQQQIEVGEANLNELQETKSIDAYTNVVNDHIKATQAQIESIEEYLEQSRRLP